MALQFPFTVWDVLGAVAQQLPVVIASFWNATSPLVRVGLIALAVWAVVKPPARDAVAVGSCGRRRRRRRPANW